MIYKEDTTYKELLEHDILYIKDTLIEIKDKLSKDESFWGDEWLVYGEQPLSEYFFEGGGTILNPSELEGYMQDIANKITKR